jgi:sialate O-acetylesterase
MVLQRNADAKVWGWASKDERISLRFKDTVYHTTANSNGEWIIVFSNLTAGGPYAVEIQASNHITINDVVVGDVWVCSGQSNMELPMARVSPIYKDVIAASEDPNIRHFSVPQRYDFNTPQRDLVSGSWKKADPENVMSFSAVAYFFAKELRAKYKVPIGLINASLGGAPAQAFMSEEALKAFPDHYSEAMRFKDSTEIRRIEAGDRARIADWYQTLRARDEGHKDTLKPWHGTEIDTAGWLSASFPGYWADGPLGAVNGVVWYRKTIEIPPSLATKPAQLILGRIVDADSVFLNGVFVGTTSYQYPPRRYSVPQGILREGNNHLVVRVISEIGRGGFVPDKSYKLVLDTQEIDLAGSWLCRLGAPMERLTGQTFIRWKPVGLYNGMIHPLLNTSIKGVIWYQGESNVNRSLEYRRLFPALIVNWRHDWKQADFPFLFVQLPNFMQAKDEPSESEWALMREAQSQALSLHNTGMAVTIDIGEWNDIHPLDKKDVGKRLALAAQKIAYGDRKVIHSGPMYRSAKFIGNRVVITFTNVGGGLRARGGSLRGFAVAGSDKRFLWAKAKIQNNKVVVWSEAVPHPTAVRYAWADNPEGANLYNKEGLPASPFRTEE